jgi:hypothetical protein
VLIERERPCETGQDLIRGLVIAPLLESEVVLSADAGESGHLFAA